METETKTKIDVKKVLITTILVLLTAVAVGGGVYYVLNQNFQKEREANEKALDEVRDQVEKLAETKKNEAAPTVPAVKDETSDWLTFNDYQGIYSIKYPTGWVFREYKEGGYNFVNFADKTSNLPPDQSDAPPKISISVTNEGLNDDVTTCPSSLNKETITLAGKQTTKFTVLPGCPNSFGGDSKWVYYQVSLGSGKYLRITNVADAYSTELPKMLNSLTLR